MEDTKQCSKCLQDLPLDRFEKHKLGRYGRHSICKDCKKAMSQALKEKYRAMNIVGTPAVTLTEKKCKICDRLLPIDDFHKAISLADGHESQCKQCLTSRKRRIYQNIKASENARSRSYYKENKEKIAKQKHAYHSTPEFKKRTKELMREHRKDPKYRMMHNARNRMLEFIREGKDFSYSKALGCNRQFLIKYIESLWLPGMTWATYGFRGWHIDHIFPLSKADPVTDNEGFQKLLHYSNLQPLWWRDNISKGNRTTSQSPESP